MAFDYVGRVRALLDLAERAGSEHEAEIARGKAMELQMRHGISDAMVGETREVPDEIKQVTLKYPGIFKEGKRQIATRAAQAMGMKMVIFDNKWSKPHTSATTVTGWRTDLERLEVLVASLQIQADRALKEWEREQRVKGTGWHDMPGWLKFKDRRQFYFSFAGGAGTRLQKAFQDATKAAANDRATETGDTPDEALAGVALALRDRRESVKDWYDTHYGNGLRTIQSRRTAGSYGASAAGHAAGSRADVGSTRLPGGPRAIGR
jgi:hypothetical protein